MAYARVEVSEVERAVEAALGNGGSAVLAVSGGLDSMVLLTAAASRLSARARKKVSLKAPVSYRVKAGDTLARIALELSVSESQLKTWNPLAKTGVRAGQELFAHPNY